MGSLYNGIGLNSVNSVRNVPNSKNTFQVSGIALVRSGDVLGTNHIIYEKTLASFRNERNAKISYIPLKLPVNASIEKIYVKNISNGKANYVLSPTVVPTLVSQDPATSPNWDIIAYNVATNGLSITYLSTSDTNVNNGVVSNPISSNSNVSVTSAFQNVVLVNNGATVNLIVNSSAVPTPPVGIPAQQVALVEIVFVVTVP